MTYITKIPSFTDIMLELLESEQTRITVHGFLTLLEGSTLDENLNAHNDGDEGELHLWNENVRLSYRSTKKGCIQYERIHIETGDEEVTAGPDRFEKMDAWYQKDTLVSVTIHNVITYADRALSKHQSDIVAPCERILKLVRNAIKYAPL